MGRDAEYLCTLWNMPRSVKLMHVMEKFFDSNEKLEKCPSLYGYGPSTIKVLS